LSKCLIITSDAKLGTMESAFNVQIITISMQMEFAAKLNLNVKTSTDRLEFVKPVTKDSESSMANV
jgi:hypothetical protein